MSCSPMGVDCGNGKPCKVDLLDARVKGPRGRVSLHLAASKPRWFLSRLDSQNGDFPSVPLQNSRKKGKTKKREKKKKSKNNGKFRVQQAHAPSAKGHALRDVAGDALQALLRARPERGPWR